MELPDNAASLWFESRHVRDRDRQVLMDPTRSMCHALGLGGGSGKWPDVLDDLCALCNEPMEDDLEAVGAGELHRFLYFNVDPVPVMNLIVELSFSCLKTTEKTNNGSETTDLTMATKMEIFHPARVERLNMKRDDGRKNETEQQLDSAKQYLHWVNHCASVSKGYGVADMKEVPVTETFRKVKTSNISSSGNKIFVRNGATLRQKRVTKGTTLNLAEAAMKIMGMDIADDVMKMQLHQMSPAALHVQDCLMVSGHWDRTFTTATEKNAAAGHFPFWWLLHHRHAHVNDTALKKQMRKWLAVSKLVMRFLGRATPVKSDQGDPVLMKEHYQGMTDRMNFLEAGVFIKASQRGKGGVNPPIFQWVLPPGDPPPFCGKAGLHSKKSKAKTPKKRKAQKKGKKSTPQKRRRSSSYDGEADSDGELDMEIELSDTGSSDEDDDGSPHAKSTKLQKPSTLEDSYIMDFI